METMILVVGLAVAGLAGIAAAFYFSIRSGHGGSKRLRSAGSGHAGGDRRPGSRSHSTARPDRTDNGRRAANGSGSANAGRGANTPTRNFRAEDSTGPNPVLDFGDPALVGGRRGGSVASAGDPQATDPRLGVAASAEGGDRAARPRRRVGFHKGAHVDEELWPTETFGGVSDEQFWDDLASDKPLTTTARTAQQEPGTRNRPFAAVPPAATQPVQKMPPAPKMPVAQKMPSAPKMSPTQKMPPAPKMPAVQKMPAAQKMPPVQNKPAQVPTATQPVQAAVGISRPMSAASQPLRAADQPAETRGRRRASSSADEDPLTSAAFSLRTSGPVDGRSSLRSSPSNSGTSYGDPSSATQATNTPPHGENYGYGGGDPAAQADDPRRPNGTRSHARHGGTGEGTRATRQAYPQDDYQGTRSYQTGGYPTGGYPTGSHQGNGYQRGSYQTGGSQGSEYQGNGHRAPYDPREDYRRLTKQ
jgi:hypothetical protein